MIETDLTLDAAEFAGSVAWVTKWTPARPEPVIQGGVRIRGVGDGVVLTAYQENITAEAYVACSAATGPQADSIVSGRLLGELAATLTKGEVRIGPAPSGLHLQQGRFSAELPEMALTSWPALPGRAPAIATIDGSRLAELVKRIGIAAGELDYSNHALRAMHLGFAADGLTVRAATNEHAAKARAAWDGGLTVEPEVPFATPYAAIVTEAAGAFAGAGQVQVGLGTQLSFSSEARMLSMRTVDLSQVRTGPVTGWPAQIVESFATMPLRHRVTLDRADATAPLKRAVIVRGRGKDDKALPVQITFEPDEIEIATTSGRGRDSIPAQGYEGERLTLGLNPQYLGEALAAAPGPDLTLEFEGPRHPVRFTAPDADPTWMHVVMPQLLPR